jgi:hypothetical protein
MAALRSRQRLARLTCSTVVLFEFFLIAYYRRLPTATQSLSYVPYSNALGSSSVVLFSFIDFFNDSGNS